MFARLEPIVTSNNLLLVTFSEYQSLIVPRHRDLFVTTALPAVLLLRSPLPSPPVVVFVSLRAGYSTGVRRGHVTRGGGGSTSSLCWSQRWGRGEGRSVFVCGERGEVTATGGEGKEVVVVCAGIIVASGGDVWLLGAWRGYWSCAGDAVCTLSGWRWAPMRRGRLGC